MSASNGVLDEGRRARKTRCDMRSKARQAPIEHPAQRCVPDDEDSKRLERVTQLRTLLHRASIHRGVKARRPARTLFLPCHHDRCWCNNKVRELHSWPRTGTTPAAEQRE